MMRAAIIAIILSAVVTVPAVPLVEQYDASEIIQRSVEANARDWEAAPQYDYFERDRDTDGNTRTNEEIMILGSPYERLVAVNGKELPPDQKEQERQKLAAAIAERKAESPDERRQRVAKYEQERKRDHLLMEQMSKAFDFKLIGEDKLGPHKTYVLKATPRSGYQPPNTEAKVLTGMEGKLWIDKETFQWVRVKATVTHPVSIAGFFARVEPGTRFMLEKTPVTQSIWLPKRFTMKAKARVFFFFTHQDQEDETYYGYHESAGTQATNKQQ